MMSDGRRKKKMKRGKIQEDEEGEIQVDEEGKIQEGVEMETQKDEGGKYI